MTYDESGLYIDPAHLEGYAENLARSLKPREETGGRAMAAELRRALREIGSVHDAMALRWADVPAMPGAVRWLLDNHYLARREGQAAASALAACRGGLRATDSGTVLRAACAALVRSGCRELDGERLETFLRGFQKALILTGRELALLGDGLRAALIGELLELCRRLPAAEKPDALELDFQRVFSSLRWLSAADQSGLIERADYTEQTLRRDPAGIYPLMDEASREHYRRRVARMARRLNTSEYRAALQVLSRASGESGGKSHVGWWLLRAPLGFSPKRRRGGLYIAVNVLLPLLVSLLAGFAWSSPAVFFLLLLPVSALVKSLMDFILLRTVPPAHIPRLALDGGVPDDGRTLCAVSALLTDEESGPALARRLEEYRQANRDCGENLLFAILADLPDTDTDPFPGQEAILAAAKAAVDGLNERCGGGFYLLFRPRVLRDGRWMGWERKRGALLEAMRLLRGKPSSLRCLAGDAGRLPGVRFLLALDCDTRLTPGSARELIGAMLHPLNRPVVDPEKHIVRAGHGVISPRLGVDLTSSTASDFARVFAGQGGTDPYGGACGQVYMDLWESGGFAGKGILDVDAALECLDGRFPENRVLSHDALEGAFLRGGFMGDTELTDAFPSGALSYYKRLERWTRGDWQNLPWLFRRGRELPDIERFRLFDSLRRSLVPVMSFAAIFAGFFLPRTGLALAAATALLACARQLLLTTAETLFQSEERRGLRLHSTLYVGVGGGLVRTVLELILLPVEARFCLSALCRALWRLGVSRKQLLAWQTAGQTDRGGTGFFRYYRAMWPAAAAGLAALLLSPSVLGRAAGAIWLLSPLCALLLSLPSAPPPELCPLDRAYLRECAADTWRYFDTFLTAGDNYLPPDNYQAQPPVGLAHRSSPTNMGLGLLSVLAACDLGLTDADRGLDLIARMLDSLERLPKWKGHLYNWYDTETLEPLTPRYVSTVDSGNLRGCLIALRAGLEDYGRPDLARRTDDLLAPMSFAPLYDPQRRLFTIGWDTDAGEPTPSWYDLMASEARLTGFLAVALGDVPRRHWRKLSRAQLRADGYRGMASWTGTMFEYLMPELLLPLYRDSLLYESARFCLYVQKRRTAGEALPWGISESAYYALDPSMSYRYKAHGCSGLALKRGMDAETVISPYSSFLALCAEPRAAVANLRRLDALGMRGRYGFWEALDFTPSRTEPGRPGLVRCVMSHHAGMSLVAASNCLLDGVMVRRLMRDAAVRGHACLLQERVPLDGVVLRRREREVPARPAPRPSPVWESRGSDVDYAAPACCLLSGRTYSLLFAATGLSRPLWGAVSPYVCPASPLDRERGMEFWLRTGAGDFSLLPDGTEGQFSHRFTTACASLCRTGPGFTGTMTVSLPAGETGELREVAVANTGTAPLEARLVLRFRPLLARYEDYVNHPAFYGLGLSARVREGCLVIRRLRRGNTPELFLCLAPSQPCRYGLTPGADTGRTGPAVTADAGETWLTEPLVEAELDLAPEPGTAADVRFALCAAHSEEEALASAARALASGESDRADLPRTAAALLGLDAAAIGRAFALLPRLCFPAPPLPLGCLRREELWRFGISGDLPILCMDYPSNALLDKARELMDAHLFLTGCGADFDLVFLCRDGASYRQPLSTALSEELWQGGGEVLLDARGGVHILEDGEGANAVRSCAQLLLSPEAPLLIASPGVPLRPRPAFFPLQDRVRRAWTSSGAFEFYVNRSLPRRAWQNVLTNGRLGYLATDCGTGNLWYLNARENAISPWLCRPYETEGPETLSLQWDGDFISLFAAPEDRDTVVRFEPGVAAWEKRVRGTRLGLTAFIPPDTDARVFLLRTEGLPEGTVLHWQLRLRMAPGTGDARFCLTRREDGLLRAENPRAMAQARNSPFLAACSAGTEDFTCERASALALCYDGKYGACAEPVFALRFPAGETAVLVCGCDRPERIRALCAPEAAERALAETRARWRSFCGRFSLRSPCRELDRLLNGWLPYQVLACRLLGRCSLYQSGGAYGFRDQLQDAVNLMLLDSRPAREQLLRCCARQYTEGDVQHWWHEGDAFPRGVRTRCGDDLLWLPWALCEYVEATGDRGLCAETVPYLHSRELGAEEHDRYEEARESGVRESVLRHGLRALERVIRRGTGPHGLLLMGSGDWNDGYDRVGGESLWLTWFFIHTAARFAGLLDRLGESGGARLREAAEALTGPANAAWDGDWFLRGWYAGGKPLGSGGSAECRIDSVAQSMAAFCPGADPEKVDRALDSALEQLFDREHGLVKLLAPPFAGREHPGYIESYGPGFRENGGQYTHAALWLALALLRRGRTDRAWELLRALLPAGKDDDVYRAEPFVLAADVYAAPGHEGEAGWSWYTGAAGWLFRIVTGELLGLKLRDGRLYIEPSLPPDWPGFRVRLAGRDIRVERDRITVDGVPWTGEGLSCPPPENFS